MESNITKIFRAAGGDKLPSEDLLPLVYDELRRLAIVNMSHERVGHTLQPTALVHEAWLRLAGTDQRLWNNRTHFFRAAAQAMRRILVDRARQKDTHKRGGEMSRIDISEVDLSTATQDDRVLLVNEMLERLEKDDPQAAQIITMKFFGGLTNHEIGTAMGLSDRTVDRRWNYLKATLFQMIQEEL
jgi:RNA polymerase sigma factor (TIGR02999 family)